MRTYDDLKARIQELQADGQLPSTPTNKQRADWAYGNTAIDCKGITRSMAERAVADKHGQ